MEVKAVRVTRLEGVSRFEADIESRAAVNPQFSVRFDFHTDVHPPEISGDAWLAALIVPSMFAGEDLMINAPVSRQLAGHVNDVQIILNSWFPDVLKRVRVITPILVRPTPRLDEEGPTASFFSGGVDSWYTLLKHEDEISGLITVKGFDLSYSDQTLWPGLVNANREITRELGKELVLVETDVRDRLDPNYKCFNKEFTGDFWGECMHGACMGAAGLMLQNRFPRIVVPASMQYSFLPPWGSHPLVDPLWSNGQVRFYHDGCEALRLEKLRAIVKSDVVLRHLRVCPSCVPGRYNCGVCEKCRRTMMTLRLFGVLDRATCFDRPLDLREMELMPLTPIYFPTYREMLEEATRVGDADVARLVRILIREQVSPRREWDRLRKKAGRILPRFKRSINKRLVRLGLRQPSTPAETP